MFTIPSSNLPPRDGATGFGAVKVGASLARSFEIVNRSKDTMSIASITVSGQGSGVPPFAISGIPGTINSGDSATFKLTYSPKQIGSDTDKITISCDKGTPFIVNVTGSGN